MSKKSIHPIWHVVYISLIIASLVYWKKQNDLHNAWLHYVAPTNKSLVDFLKNDNQNIQSSINKKYFDYPSPPADSVHHLTEQLCTLAGKIDTSCESIALQMNQSKDYSLPPAVSAQLAQQWQAYTTAFSALKIKDTLLTPEIKNLLEPSAFEKWQSTFQGGNEKEQRYLLNGLQRLSYTTLSIMLNHHWEVVESFNYYPQFDGVKIAMNTNHRPVAGQPFTAEFYPIWYSTRTDNVTAYIDGRKYNFENGIAHCDTVYQTPGKKKVVVQISVKNPATGTVETVKKEFEIEVIQ